MVAYKYYVVYEVYKEGKLKGKGAGEVYFKKKIEEERDIKEVGSNFLSGHPEGDDILITNFILMSEVDYGEQS